MRALRFHARATCGSRRWPSRRRQVQATRRPVAGAASAGRTCTSTRAGPIVTPTSPHPLTGATLPQILGHELSAEVVASARREQSRGRRPRRRHAAHVLRPLRLLPPWSSASLRDDGLHGPQRRLGRDGRARERSRSTRCSDIPDDRDLRAGGADRAVRGGRLRRRAGRRRPGDSVLIAGAGPIGAFAALCAAAAGASSVYISEPNQSRRERAERLELGEVFDPSGHGCAGVSGSGRDGLGVDMAIECAGHSRRLRLRRSVMRRRGTVVQVGLLVAEARSSRCCGRSTT